MFKDKSVIPKGYYCHDSKDVNKVCPYWKESGLYNNVEMLNGYCGYMEKNDHDLTIERMKHDIEITFYHDNKPTFKRNLFDHEKREYIKEGGWTLLWDKCKECGVNINE